MGFDPALSWSASLTEVSVDRRLDNTSSSSILDAAASPAARTLAGSSIFATVGVERRPPEDARKLGWEFLSLPEDSVDRRLDLSSSSSILDPSASPAARTLAGSSILVAVRVERRPPEDAGRPVWEFLSLSDDVENAVLTPHLLLRSRVSV